MRERVSRLQKFIENHDLDGFLVTHPSNIRYLTGYTGSNGLCYITDSNLFFFTDFRYKTQSIHEVSGWDILIAKSRDLISTLKAEQVIQVGDTIGFEGNNLSYEDYQRLKTLFPEVSFSDRSRVVEKFASIKDTDEIRELENACSITDSVFSKICTELGAGMEEREIAARISWLIRMEGGEADSFPPIVAAGVNAARPHHRSGLTELGIGDMVILDFGAVFNGYHADLTRTVSIGPADRRLKEIYEIVANAQLMAVDAAQPGISGKELDAVARDFISSAGYGEFFGHSLGHGIGLTCQSWPAVSAANDDILLPGQTFTVEPGIYIPDWGGVRIEDDVLLTENGPQLLTKSPRKLIEL